MLQPRTIIFPRLLIFSKNHNYHFSITLSEACGHSSFLLVAISYAVDDFLQLRMIAVAGSAVMLCFTYFHPYGRVLWLPLKWNALFIAINSYRIGKVLLDQYFAETRLSPEILKMRDSHFYSMDPIDFYKLVRIGSFEHFRPGDHLMEQDMPNECVRLVMDGELHVVRDNQVTYRVVEGNFLSEKGLHAGLLLPGSVESCASIVAITKGKTLTWNRTELMDLLKREQGLLRALKTTLTWDIVRKLKGQRLLLREGAVDNPDQWTQRRTEQSQHRYAIILREMLQDPQYLKKRKQELQKYRLIHHIDDEDHELALLTNGWTVEDFERGCQEKKPGNDSRRKTSEKHQKGEEESSSSTEHDFKWHLHDMYMRIFG